MATGIALGFQQSAISISVVGIAIIVLGFCGIAWRHRSLISGVTCLTGVIFLDKKTRLPIKVSRYEASESFYRNILGLCAENKALAKIWKDSKFYSYGDTDNTDFTITKGSSAKLAEEALEYFVLSKLSTHLTDYFNKSDFDKGRIKTFFRNDVPDVLLSNRFIDLFSRPLEEREAFSASHSPPSRGKVVYASGPSGEIFNDFDFTLPTDAKVSRNDDTSVLIDTKRFSVSIKSIVRSGSGYVPFAFYPLYMKREWDDVETYNFSIRIEIRISPWRILSRKGWEYYSWLDSFMDRLELDVDFDKFLDRISWNQALTVHQLGKNGSASM